MAAKISILLHIWSGSTADEITEKTMRAAIRLTRALANESSAVACAFAAGDEHRQIREAGEEMLEKLKRLLTRAQRPVTRRELYRTYDEESRKLHDPALEFLVQNGQVQWVEVDGLVLAPETSGESYETRNG
jgi:hypothetical protein